MNQDKIYLLRRKALKWIVRKMQPAQAVVHDWPSLTEASLEHAAERKTNLPAAGLNDFREGLRQLLRSAEEEASLSFVGRFRLRATLVNRLVNQLTIRRELEEKPEILSEKIQRPL